MPAALTPSPSSGTAPSAAGSGQGADEFVRPGGFHESSYELQHGLQVSESEWPVEVAMPTPQGSH